VKTPALNVVLTVLVLMVAECALSLRRVVRRRRATREFERHAFRPHDSRPSTVLPEGIGLGQAMQGGFAPYVTPEKRHGQWVPSGGGFRRQSDPGSAHVDCVVCGCAVAVDLTPAHRLRCQVRS